MTGEGVRGVERCRGHWCRRQERGRRCRGHAASSVPTHQQHTAAPLRAALQAILASTRCLSQLGD